MPQYDHIQVNTRVELEELTKISIKHGGWLIHSTPKLLPLTIYSNSWRGGSLHPLCPHLLPRSIYLRQS
jgi:hypothetical protein